jgi:hypothetical protein
MKVAAAFPGDLDVHGTTDLDVAKAIATDTPFPERPDATIGLGHIAFATGSGTPLAFTAAGTPVHAAFSADVAASVGVFPDRAAAIASLNLGDTPGLDFAIAADSGTRYAVLASSYSATGSADAVHPLGVVGRLTIGASGASAGTLAVLHRFQRDEGARSVLEQTLGSWALPRDVRSAADLRPGTWLIGEVDGTIALNVTAALGYNLDFVRTVKAGTLAGDIGLAIDAAVNAAFGLEVGGRYLVVVGRETADERVRVQLFKLTRKGLTFGVNLKVGVTGVETVAPEKVDDFIAAVFGVHGPQIVAALQGIDKWTDPAQSVGTLVAGLTNEKAQDLFRHLTGEDLRTEFEAVRARVLDAIREWETLDAKVSAELWTIIGRLGDHDVQLLKHSLALLSTTDPAAQRDAFESLLSDAGFAGSPLAQLLNAAADHGLLALLDRAGELRALATTVNAILDGGVIENLQQYVERELKLDAVLNAVTRTDFDALDQWLVGRLSVFFDKTLRFEDLNAIKDAIHLALAQRQQMVEKVTAALNSRYGFDLAATWQRTTADTALFDAEFDTARPDGRELLAALLQRSDFARIITVRTPATRIRTGVLTHELTRKTTLHVSLPHVNLQQQTINHALARVEVDASGPDLLVYQTTGEDVVDARNRFRSTLSVGVAAVAASGASGVVVHSLDGTWSYQLLTAGAGMRRADFEAATRPFIETFMLPQFAGATKLSDWYELVDDSVEARLHNGSNTFGDVCIACEVTVPSAALGAWFTPPTGSVHAAAKTMAIAIQRALKQVVAFYYLTETTRLRTLGSSAALLAWAAIPPANAVVGDEVIWDHRDNRQLSMMTGLAVAHVAARLPALRLRLQEAHMNGTLPFYGDDQAASIVATALAAGKPLLVNLLDFERSLVAKAANAYEQAQAFVRSDNAASALERLADFAADITRAFNTLAAETVFVGPAFRPVAQSVFVEAARALDPAIAARPSAMLTVSVLNPARTFDIGAFPAGSIPPPDQVVVGERLVSIAARSA